MHGKHTDEKRIAKPFETDGVNGCKDEENFCTDAVKRKHGWRKFWTDAVERIHGWREIFWTDYWWAGCLMCQVFLEQILSVSESVRIQCMFLAITEVIRVLVSENDEWK